MRKILISLIVFQIVSFSDISAQSSKSRIDSIFHATINKNTAGAAAIVIKEGKTIHTGYYG